MAQAVDIQNRPNMREFMDATGVDAKAASEILYGTIGANTDTRDWAAIMASDDPVQASIQANLAQYSDGSATSNLDREAYPTNFGNPVGDKAGIVKTETGFALVSSDGVPLRAGFNSLEQAQEQGKYFGITDFLGDSRETTTVVNRSASPSSPFSPSVPSTPVATVGAGQVADVNPLPQTVTQQVTPPTYYNQPQIQANTAISNERAGTFSKPLQTAGLSAVPQQVTYKTHYAGTPGLVDPTLTLAQTAPQAVGNVGMAEGGYVSSFNEGGTVSKESIQNLADLVYLSQNTGVSSAKLKAAYEAVGVDSSDNFAFVEANRLLEDAGYTPGDNEKFYGNKAAVDPAAQIFKERWQNAPTKEELKAAGLDPDTVVVTNNNLANSVYLQEQLKARGLSTSDTNASIRSRDEYEKSQADLEERLKDNSVWGDRIKTAGSYDNATLDMLEWDLIKKKVEEKPYTGPTESGTLRVTPTLPNGTVPAGPPVAAQAVPQNVTQAVSPPLYNSTGFATTNIGDARSGTFSKPLQTAGLSAVPMTASYKTHYAGTQGLVDPTILAPTVGAMGTQQVLYKNNLGQQMMVTEVDGKPMTYVPPGFVRQGTAEERQQQQQSTGMSQGGDVSGYAAGGQSEDLMLEAKFRIASMNGYNGPKTNTALNAFANASPGMSAKFSAIGATMNKGGYVKRYAEGGAVSADDFKQMQQNLVAQTMQPMQAPVEYIQPNAAQFIPVDAGQTLPIAPYAEAATVQTVQQAELPTTPTAATFDSLAAAPQVAAETDKMQAAQGTVSDQAQVSAAQQATSSVTGMQAAQGQATMVNAPAAREIQAGELISGVADAEKAAQFNEQIQAAEATPTAQATVQGQLEGLMQQFEGGETPAWAAGSMRAAMANLSARGLGASSMAGQAVIQATMEAALPIAQIDAQTQAQFESQNLSNRQQRAMLAAQQRAQFLGMEFDQAFQARVQNSARIGDVANMNFTAEQNIALENSRAANTMNLNNLSNRQAMVMAEAAALSNLDMSNLNNRQQAAVQNAQNFLQMDMQNLSNEQQTAMFKSQQNVQALFTDQAAENASRQFNAASENQTNQFFANLTSQTAQFNASQQNAMDQFNVNSVNALREFNSNIQQQRDMFNAQNGLVIAQSNAQWRQNLDTLNTAALNESNRTFAQTINGLTAGNLEQIWQRERDIMSFAFSSSESAKDRALSILLGDMEVAALDKKIAAGESAGKTKVLLDVFGDPVKDLAGNVLGDIFGF